MARKRVWGMSEGYVSALIIRDRMADFNIEKKLPLRHHITDIVQ